MSNFNNKDFIEFLKNQPSGVIDIKDKEPLFFYDPNCEFNIDKNGNKTKRDYICSYIISLRKYSLGHYSVSSIPLGSEYHGENVKKTLKYMNSDWNIDNFQLVGFSGLNISSDWHDFVKKQ